MLTASQATTPTTMTTASQIMFRFDTMVTLLSRLQTDVCTTAGPSRGCSTRSLGPAHRGSDPTCVQRVEMPPSTGMTAPVV